MGLFGGTFDPPHLGHVRSVQELAQQLELDSVALIPCYQPVHRATPGASDQQRAEMLALAIANAPRLRVDDCEIRRAGPSYSVDTLIEKRRQLGADCALYWIVGTDAFAKIETWHRYEELLQYANIAVMHRAGEMAPWRTPEIWGDCELDDVAAFKQCRAGAVMRLQLQAWDISATAVRQHTDREALAETLVDRSVLEYIQQHRLYRNEPTEIS